MLHASGRIVVSHHLFSFPVWSFFFQPSINMCRASFKTALSGGFEVQTLQYWWAACNLNFRGVGVTSVTQQAALNSRWRWIWVKSVMQIDKKFKKQGLVWSHFSEKIYYVCTDWENWCLIKGGTCLQLFLGKFRGIDCVFLWIMRWEAGSKFISRVAHSYFNGAFCLSLTSIRKTTKRVSMVCVSVSERGFFLSHLL